MDSKLHSLCSVFIIALLAVPKRASAWTQTGTIQQQSRARIFPSILLSTPDAANPCWQDNYDSEDDCLSTIYSAAFVAEEWIKSMPCGKDADCLPENLSHPGTMGDSVSFYDLFENRVDA